MSETPRLPRLLITGSRTHQWTPYDSHALLIAVQEIVEKTQKRPTLVHGGATGADTAISRLRSIEPTGRSTAGPLAPSAISRWLS